MVIKKGKAFPLKDMKISHIVLTSGLLTFIYCIELCIGIRTIYYTFNIWCEQAKESKHVSLISCIACLFTAVISTFTINALSALWEQKQLEERGKKKSYVRFVFHIIIGCMVWRYINLGCIDSKECQKKGALLLTMAKFFFTQTFTIPLVIVHASVLVSYDELIYVFCTVLCISVNLILTCVMFDWCYAEVEELKKWKFETVELVPLIFQWDAKVIAERESKIYHNSVSKEVSKQEKGKEYNERKFEERIIKFLVLLQSFGFSFGRLLALGILLKFAGIYAVSIMFLQLLISVIYLKFQVPILVSESLPKWRQLSRLAFMSYILIFEWYLNRDPKTAYDFSSSMKHSITYYCIATVESVFYLVTWAVTTSFSTRSEFGDEAKQQNRFCRVILILGSLALVFSLTIHIVLLFWRSRRISVFLYSVRRRYETAKLQLSKYGCVKEKNKKIEKTRKLTPSDISDPIPIQDNDDETNKERTGLPKQSSYRDLKEPVDDEIEIYFRKCENKSKEDITDQEHDNAGQTTVPVEDTAFSHTSVVIQTIDHLLHSEMKNLKSTVAESSEKAMTPEKSKLADAKNKKNEEESTKNPKKLKRMLSSENLTEQWEKMSSASRKFASSMKEQIHKRNKQIRGSPKANKAETEGPVDSFPPSQATDDTTDSGIQTPEENVEISEGFFIGDSRCHPNEPLSSIVEKRLRFADGISGLENADESAKEADEETNLNHKVGDSPCSCYICKALGDGRFRRRRSSSVPPAVRKSRQEEDENGSSPMLTRFMSSPNIPQSRCEKRKFDYESREEDKLPIPTIYTSTVFNLDYLSQENRIEHYV